MRVALEIYYTMYTCIVSKGGESKRGSKGSGGGGRGRGSDSGSEIGPALASFLFGAGGGGGGTIEDDCDCSDGLACISGINTLFFSFTFFGGGNLFP